MNPPTHMNEDARLARIHTHMHLALALTLLCTLALPAVRGANVFGARNNTGLLFMYLFDDGQQQSEPPAFVRDVSGNNLIGNLTTSTTGAVAWNAARQGMLAPNSSAPGFRAVSQQTSAGVLSRLGSEFTIEIFFTNTLNGEYIPAWQNLHIASFGDIVPGQPFAACNETDVVHSGGWQFFSRWGNGVSFSGVLRVNGIPTCVTLSHLVPPDVMHHLVIRMKNGTLSMDANNVIARYTTQYAFPPVPPDTIAFLPSLWARNPAPLVVANPHETKGWRGTMHMIAMYDRFLPDDEVTANRNRGLPNSLAVGNHTAHAAIHRTRGTIFEQVACSDYDGDPTEAQLQSLPSHGTLWHDDEEVTADDLPLTFTPGSLEYRSTGSTAPPATIRYACSDGFALGRESAAVVSIELTNAPPTLDCGLCTLVATASTDASQGSTFSIELEDEDPGIPSGQLYAVTIATEAPLGVSVSDPALLAAPNVHRVSGDGLGDFELRFIAPFAIAQQILAGPLRVFAPTPTATPQRIAITVTDRYFLTTAGIPTAHADSLTASANVTVSAVVAPEMATSTSTSAGILVGSIAGSLALGAVGVVGWQLYKRRR
jgi:hypothetical protein